MIYENDKAITMPYGDYLKLKEENERLIKIMDLEYRDGNVIKIETHLWNKKYSISTKNIEIIQTIKKMEFFDLMKVRYSKKSFEILT